MAGWRPQAGGPLNGLRVAVCGSGAAVWHAGRLLAALGAVVDSEDDGAWREADGVIDAVGMLPPAATVPMVRTVDTTAAEDWAASGAMMLTGRRDGPPLPCPGQPASVAWGALLATELLARVGGRDVVLPGPRVLGERAAIAGFRRNAPWSADGTFRVARSTMDSCAAPFVLNGLSRDAVWSDRPMWTDRKRWRWPELLVADLSSGWAGPLCGHILTLLGARVLKIEDPDRPDTARSGSREFFDLLHSGQESVALAPEKTGRLIEAADVVIDDVLADPPAVAEDKCWLRITGGSGDEEAVAAGLVAEDRGVLAPCGDAIAAPLTGVSAALTAVACRLGGGWWFAELSQRAQAAATLTGSLDGSFRAGAAPPVARRPAGHAASLGAHTAQILHEFG